MFDSRNRVEGYIFDEKEEAYSNIENRKDYLKEEIVSKFIQFSKKNTCKSVEKEQDEVKTKYIAKFVDRIPLSIIVYNNTLELNKDIVTALDKCLKSKQDNKERKIIIRNKILLTTILTGGIVLSPLGFNSLVKLDNKNFDLETQTSQDLYDEQQSYLLHQEAIKKLEEDNRNQEIEIENESSELQDYMQVQQENYEQEQQRLLEESRDYDFNNEEVKIK
jgi:hypothetical protein